jgi:hypothetical protein
MANEEEKETERTSKVPVKIKPDPDLMEPFYNMKKKERD